MLSVVLAEAGQHPVGRAWFGPIKQRRDFAAGVRRRLGREVACGPIKSGYIHARMPEIFANQSVGSGDQPPWRASGLTLRAEGLAERLRHHQPGLRFAQLHDFGGVVADAADIDNVDVRFGREIAEIEHRRRGPVVVLCA